jgi:hypothetical protein
MQVTCLQRKLVLVTSRPSETSKSAHHTTIHDTYCREKVGRHFVEYTGGVAPKLAQFRLGFGMDPEDYWWGRGTVAVGNGGCFTTISFFSSLYSCSLDFSGNYDSLYEVRSRTVGYIRTLLTRHTAWVLAEREGYLCGCCNNDCDACTDLAAKKK